MRTIDAILAESLTQDRLGAMVTAIFAAAGLLLVALGLYGVLSFAVSQETHEIGMRLALGASRLDVIRLVAGRGLRMTAIGLAAGAIATWIAARILQSVMADLTLQPQLIAAAAVVLLVATLGATVLPARRALGLDPLSALRSD